MLLFAFNLMGIGWLGHFYLQQQNFPNGSSSGGVTNVTVLPGSCTAGTLVSLTVNGAALGTFTCTANGVFVPENPSQSISPYSYGAVGHVRFTYNASWANGSTTISCSNGECNFQCPNGSYPCTSATAGCPSVTCDAGKIIKGAGMFPQVNTQALVAAGVGVTLPQGLISTVTNSTTITASTTTTSACPTGGVVTCTLSWGIQDDTTALNNAANAAWSNGNRCLALQLASDNFYFTGPVFNIPPGQKAGDPCSTLAAANGGSDLTNSGPTVFGQGAGTTTLIPLSMNYANCTFGSTSIACMGTMPNLQAHDFAVNGLGDIGSGNHVNVLWESVGSNAGGACDGGTTVWNMSLSNFGLNATGLIGFQFGAQSCAAAQNQNNAVVMFGSTTCAYKGTQVYSAMTLYCAGAGAGLGNVFNINNSGGQLNTFGSQFVCTLNAGNQVVAFIGGGSPTKWNSNGDMFRQGDAQCNVQGSIILPGKGLIDFTDDQVIMGTNAAASTFGYIGQNLSSVMHSKNTIWNGNAIAGATLLTTGASDKFYDDGGNTFTSSGTANSIAAGTWVNSFSVTGTTITAAKLVLSGGWGASAAWTALSGNTRLVQGTLTNTGAGQGASPTITYTFPTPFVDVSSVICSASQVGGTQGAILNTFTPSALTVTGVTFTYNGTPTVNLTEIVQISCDSR